jgi:extracellular elastinolytic metalloproteinase
MKFRILHFRIAIVCTLLIASTTALFSQELTSGTAVDLIRKNAASLGLSKNDLQNLRISSAYVDRISGASLVYAQQTYKGVDVFNAIQTYAFKNQDLISAAGARVAKMDELANVKNIKPAITAEKSVSIAASDLQLAAPALLGAPKQTAGLQEFDFGKLDISSVNVKSRLIWLTDESVKTATLTWQVEIQPKNVADYWLVNVDALKGIVLSKINLNVSCNWGDPARVGDAVNNSFTQNAVVDDNTESIQAINSAKYKVVAYPAENVNVPGGAPSVQTNPWLLAGSGNNSGTLTWNDNGTTSFDSSRGNNVLAQEDLNGNNGSGLGAHSTQPVPNLVFNYTPNFAQDPTTATNQQFALTNLFYWNNIMHDISYQYGFNEVSGNFQANNLSRGGLGNDYVLADGQDGSGTNNANFATPPDGSSPRMQMFLFDGVPSTTVIKPAQYAGKKTSTESAFSTANKLNNVGPVQNKVVLYADDATDTVHLACNPPVNPTQLAGKIALIDRGTCSFTIKVKNAQNAGAIAAIVADNVPEYPISMGGTDNTITIPAVMVSQVTGDSMKLVLGLTPGLVVKLAGGVRIDGDLDNGVISHEATHGISNRLTGGPNTTSCLGNKEQMGEGWSDYVSLMVTQNWATTTLADSSKARAIGTYVLGQAPDGPGIRVYPYSHNLAVNPWTYDSLKLSSRFGNNLLTLDPHIVGEVWCNILWVMTWDIAQQMGTVNPNLYNAAGNGFNNVALQLVMQGMKLQPCSPGFVDGRNAILKADTILYGAAHSAAIWKAFASRGLGYSASEGSSNNVKDGVAAYDLPPAPIVKSNQAQAAVAKSTGIISIAPNPATNKVTLTFSGNKNQLSVDLMTATGQQLSRYYLTDESLLINLPKLASGMYYLKITGDGVSETRKLIIQ